MPFSKSHSLAFWLSNLTSGASLVTITNGVLSLYRFSPPNSFETIAMKMFKSIGCMQDFLPEYRVSISNSVLFDCSEVILAVS